MVCSHIGWNGIDHQRFLVVRYDRNWNAVENHLSQSFHLYFCKFIKIGFSLKRFSDQIHNMILKSAIDEIVFPLKFFFLTKSNATIYWIYSTYVNALKPQKYATDSICYQLLETDIDRMRPDTHAFVYVYVSAMMKHTTKSLANRTYHSKHDHYANTLFF